MKVNLKCIYGDKHPNENPHELKDEAAKKLIADGLAEETKKQVVGNKQLEAELKAKDEAIVTLETIVEEAIASAKDKVPVAWKEYKAAKEA